MDNSANKPIGEMTNEERTKYSIQRAPDYKGKEEAILSNNRKECWNARDKYFECLDKNSENELACTQFYNTFKDSCLNSWCEYFIKKRKQDKLKQEFLSKNN
ncbi:cytochrome c oxidase subunit VIb [Tieghemostelium lacteum]|uniref:Cytochrome c oxidase subunit VIb n=1 Tax=Tieghemostelium lacteum TaxID=361077 RepID=A0A151ZF22_TIELA|nr:cytochrome c oxidase subunit VIb [Tieghemostelium lacteum]|eukprot:KYQ92517.1 cytochrome c oxidase subunit VIb [Tieghemostelium lacteum]